MKLVAVAVPVTVRFPVKCTVPVKFVFVVPVVPPVYVTPLNVIDVEVLIPHKYKLFELSIFKKVPKSVALPVNHLTQETVLPSLLSFIIKISWVPAAKLLVNVFNVPNVFAIVIEEDVV